MSLGDELAAELEDDRERSGYWCTELPPEALRILADAGATLIVSAGNLFASMDSTLSDPELVRQVAALERTEYVRAMTTDEETTP